MGTGITRNGSEAQECVCEEEEGPLSHLRRSHVGRHRPGVPSTQPPCTSLGALHTEQCSALSAGDTVPCQVTLSARRFIVLSPTS